MFSNFSEEPAANPPPPFARYPSDKDYRFFQNVGKYLPDSTKSNPQMICNLYNHHQETLISCTLFCSQPRNNSTKDFYR
jgi:hypothetical protein